MALSRRTGQRFQASIWPGFVDAMTGLLLVLMFVLTIFMVVQFVLRETITGQADKLDALSAEVAALASALGLEQQKSGELQTQVGTLRATLVQAETAAERQAALISALTIERDSASAALDIAKSQITIFEAQVAGLLAQREDTLAVIADLEGQRDTLLTEQEALNLALAQARTEIDAGAEAARLAAAQREALDALVAELRAKANADAETNTALAARVTDLETRLSEEEQRRLAEIAAAEAMRARLENSDAEITAMTLALEEQRKKAEETLTLLAAAEAAQQDLDLKLASAVLAEEDLQNQLAQALLSLQSTEAASEDAREELAIIVGRLEDNQAELAKSEAELATVRAQLEVAQTGDVELRQSLEAALAAQIAAQKQNETLTANLEEVKTRLSAALADKLAAETAVGDQETVRAQLAGALAAKIAAEQAAAVSLNSAEERARLLALANQTLEDTRSRATESEKQAAVLNQQVAALRTQLGELQTLLDDSKARDAAAQVQLQSLGQDLNAALARAAAEERRRRLLEEEERKRLEIEAARLAAEASTLANEAQDLARYRSEFFGRMRDLLGSRDGVRIVGDRFVFSSEVLFPSGAATLGVEGRIQIATIAQLLEEVAAEIPPEINWVLQVDGHTDNVPIINGVQFQDNWELSQARALSVVRYLAGDLGLPPDRLSANGFGEFQPIDPADNDVARAKNRRIELKFTEK